MMRLLFDLTLLAFMGYVSYHYRHADFDHQVISAIFVLSAMTYIRVDSKR